ncbi:DinB family protein [Mucilaginibacter sp. BJC16-A38]|uniref:DinB family protein n=1 Tax=Mucilaginibacter phenanthrenivorans TaxID=1234842 RepID=UPI0021580E65|nr:DinB family protein [Mucilaginibacter phenanthrenivorans]MCR8556293.1 DinB family protein [Mucilaginibacter phenanthrenivorans]
MKNYFIRLLNYDRYANETILAAMLKTDPPEKSIQLMAHLLTAQQIWLNRCKGLPPIASVLWPEGKTEAFVGTITSNSEAWSSYLDTLQPDDFEKAISYKNSQGDSFQNKLSDVLAHLINHGTHHRAQIGQQLKFAGIESLPNTDYIFYIRQLNG